MGSMRTLQKGKKTDALQRELDATLRRARNEIADLFAAYGFEVRGDWIQVDDRFELVFDDATVGSGGIRVFRRNSCGRFHAIRFLDTEDPDEMTEVYRDAEAEAAQFEKRVAAAQLQNRMYSNVFFMDLDWFLENVPTWIEEMIVSCPDCDGTGQTTLDGNDCDCPTCEGDGEIYRDSLP